APARLLGPRPDSARRLPPLNNLWLALLDRMNSRADQLGDRTGRLPRLARAFRSATPQLTCRGGGRAGEPRKGVMPPRSGSGAAPRSALSHLRELLQGIWLTTINLRHSSGNRCRAAVRGNWPWSCAFAPTIRGVRPWSWPGAL